MSHLVREWYEHAKESIQIAPCDTVHLVVCDEPSGARLGQPNRRVAIGGVIDGRKGLPGVVLAGLTTDGQWQELGCSSADQARAIVEVLCRVWPEARGPA